MNHELIYNQIIAAANVVIQTKKRTPSLVKGCSIWFFFTYVKQHFKLKIKN
jgi:hypothetical protein